MTLLSAIIVLLSTTCIFTHFLYFKKHSLIFLLKTNICVIVPLGQRSKLAFYFHFNCSGQIKNPRRESVIFDMHWGVVVMEGLSQVLELSFA